MNKFLEYIFSAYLVIGVLTFGYAFNAEYPENRNDGTAEVIAVSQSVMCAAVWPLYLSAKMFSGVRQK